jgi:hypothetical protein
VTAVRRLYAAAGVFLLLGLWLRVVRSPLPGAEVAPPALPMAGMPAAPAATAAGAPRYAAIVAANIFSQTRAAPSARFTPPGLGGGRGLTQAKPRGPALKLYGVTVGPAGAVALIDADPKIPGAEIYRVGDLVAGAPLVAITDSTVTLAEPSGPLILRLSPAQRARP